MPDLTRDALFAALRRRRHYGTTGTRLFMDVAGHFRGAGDALLDDPQLGPAEKRGIREALMGDIIRPGATPMRPSREVIGTAPIERVDVMHGARVAETVRPYTGRRFRPAGARALARRGVPRPRARNEVGRKASLSGNRIERVSNP